MEQILMSSPGSHADWDGDQNNLGFMLLDSNDPVTPGGNEETNERQLHFEEGDRNVMSLSLGEIFSENALNLDDLFRTPQYSGVEHVFPWGQDAELPASKWESQLSCSQNTPQSKQDQHLEERASPCSTTCPADASNALPWAKEATDIPESTPVCPDSLIAANSTGDVEQETGVDTLTHEPLSSLTLTHTSAQDPQQHVYTPDESAVTHRTPLKLVHTLTGVCSEPSAPAGEASTPPLVHERMSQDGGSSEHHLPQLSPEEDATQQTQQKISDNIHNSSISLTETLLTEASGYGQTDEKEIGNMTESEKFPHAQESPDGDLTSFEGGVDGQGQTEVNISHHAETEETETPTLLSSLQEDILTDQSSLGHILSLFTESDVGRETTVMQLCEDSDLSLLTTEVQTSEPLLEDTDQQVHSKQTPEEDVSLENKDVGEMPENTGTEDLVRIEGDLLPGNESEAITEHSAKTEMHEVCLNSEEVESDMLSHGSPDKNISENSAVDYVEQMDSFSEATYKSELCQHLPEETVAENTPEENILPEWMFEASPSETDTCRPTTEEGDLSEVVLEAELNQLTSEDIFSEHVPGAETSEHPSEQRTQESNNLGVEEIQHMLLADSFPEQTQTQVVVEEVFPEDVIKAGSSPDSSSTAEINPSDKTDTLDFKDIIPTTSSENTHAHIFSSENNNFDLITPANSVDMTEALQLEHFDTSDPPELEISITSPDLNAQNMDNTHTLNLENSQTHGTEHKDRTDILTSESSHGTEDPTITHTMNTETTDDSDTFNTNHHSDHLHTPDTETTTELDTTCPDQQSVDGCDSTCVEPTSNSISSQPQEKTCMFSPPESSSENSDNTPAPDSCPPDTHLQSDSVSMSTDDQDDCLAAGDLPLLFTCAGDQPSDDEGGASGQTCSANQTAAQLEGHPGEGEAPLTFTQASPEQVTQAQSYGSSAGQGTIQQLMEEKDMRTLPEYGSLDPDPPDNLEVRNAAGPIPVAMGSSSEPLRAVFQALDQDGDGFVRMEEFLEFAAAYGAEQVKDLTRFLDPSGLGVISFEDFHRGITAISNGGSEPDLYRLDLSTADASGPAEEYDEQAEVSDSVYLGSESAYSECETFTDEDTGALAPPELHEDVETDSGIENTLTEGDDHRNRFSLGADLHGHALSAVIGGEEEHFEDFGESNTSDLLLANHEEGRAGPEGAGDPEPLPHPGSPNRCSIPILSPSSGKRLSSKKAARLLQNSALGLDGMGDLSHGLLDLTDTDLTDKVLLLERRVCELEQDSALSEEQHCRLRQENLTLVHRANALEEQLKEQELRSDDTLSTHTRKHRDTMAKLQRERDLEIENLQARLQQLDEENSELRSCVPCLRANIERLEEEKRKLQDEVEDMSDRLNEELDSRRKMADKLSHERHSNQKEKECMQELIEDLRKQLEHLQLFKLEMEAKRGRSPSAGLQEYNTRTREHELEQEIRRLKQDNRSLKEQNDELNGQIINLSIQGAKNLVSESFSESLAAEINSVSRSELMEAIHKQKEINFRLQDYIDRIIVAIMECNPSILEVK